MADRIQLRRDTEANWTETDPILAQGEIAVTLDDLDTEPKFKVGDGLTLWSVLPYFGGAELTQIQSDWNQADNLSVDYLKNKPELPVYCKLISLNNILLDGSVTVYEGISISNGDIVCVNGQTDNLTNGVYIANTAGWTRVTDLPKYVFVNIEPGDSDLANQVWGLNLRNVVVGVSAIKYYRHSLPAAQTDGSFLYYADENWYPTTAIKQQFGYLRIDQRVNMYAKFYTNTHPQIDTAAAAIGKALVCIDADGNSEWQAVAGDGHTHTNKDILDDITDAGDGDLFLADDGTYKAVPATKGLAVHATDQIIPSTISVAASNFQIAGKANKKYMVDYRLYLLNSANAFFPNIQVRIGDGSGTETAYGSLLACHNDTASYNLYKVIDGTPNFNSLFDWAQGRAVYLHDGNYMHLDLQVIVEMGSTDKTIDLYITLPSTPTVPPEFTIRARSYMRWEEF